MNFQVHLLSDKKLLNHDIGYTGQKEILSRIPLQSCNPFILEYNWPITQENTVECSGIFVQWISEAQLHLVLNTPPEVELSL